MANMRLPTSVMDDAFSICSTAAAVGIFSHLFYWIHGYHDRRTTAILMFHALIYVALIIPFTAEHGLVKGVALSIAASWSYLMALFASISVYRVFFHRLRRFPGPVAAKLTKWYGPWLSRNGHLYEEHFDLIKKYGDFVRTGPNELLLFRIDAINKLHGGQTKCTKSKTMYEFFGFRGTDNIDSIKDRAIHRPRRQLWEKSLNTRALATYELRTREVIHTWIEKLATKEGRPVNLPFFADLIALDAIGKVGYSKDFNTVTQERSERILDLCDVTFAAVASLGHLDWPLALSNDLKLSPELLEFEDITVNLAEEHAQLVSRTEEDILNYFVEDAESGTPKAIFNKDILYADSQIILIGGIPTMASSMSYVFYYLTKHPDVKEKLRKAIAPSFGKTEPGEFADIDLVTVEYLDAIIEESMRLVTPGGSNAPRMTPPEGIMVDDVFIPGDTKVFAPTYAFSRSERYFKQPLEFIPERWTTRPDLIIDKRAHFPFLVGPWNCPGKRYAMMVLRQLVAYTTWYYDFDFVPGEDGSEIHSKAKFQLQIKAGKMDLVFTPR